MRTPPHKAPPPTASSRRAADRSPPAPQAAATPEPEAPSTPALPCVTPGSPPVNRLTYRVGFRMRRACRRAARKLAMAVILTSGCAGTHASHGAVHRAQVALAALSTEAPVSGKENLVNPGAHPMRSPGRHVTQEQAMIHAHRVAAPACGHGARATAEHPVVCPR